MKRFRKIIAFTLVIVSLMSVNITANAVGNVEDTIFEIEAKNNLNGTSRNSIWRIKKDYTSAWCENTKKSGGKLSTWVERTNNKNAKVGTTVDRYYGKWTFDQGATKNKKILKPGQHCYLPNYVKEDGYKYATLGYIMNRENVYYRIKWSPDSV